MAGEEVNMTFDGVSEVLGADVWLADGSVERLEKVRLEEPLFHSVSEDQTASAGQLLTGFFQQTNSGPQDYVEPQAMNEALANGVGVSKSTLEVRFGDSGIKFRQGEALVDLDRVTFDLQVTVKPHLNA